MCPSINRWGSGRGPARRPGVHATAPHAIAQRQELSQLFRNEQHGAAVASLPQERGRSASHRGQAAAGDRRRSGMRGLCASSRARIASANVPPERGAGRGFCVSRRRQVQWGQHAADKRSHLRRRQQARQRRAQLAASGGWGGRFPAASAAARALGIAVLEDA